MRTASLALLLFAALVGCGGDPAPADPRPAGPDAATPSDAGRPDAGILDAARGDALPVDAAPVDAEPPDAGPRPPDGLVRYLTGDPADRPARPAGPALLLMGGGREDDAAFAAWLARLDGGDVVVLRTSGADGYNDYVYEELGGVDSVETLLVTDRALADSPYVQERLRGAEGVFLAGGDQATYVEAWRGTAVQDGLREAWRRGAGLGGTSAGLAVLGAVSFDALEGGIGSETALADPYHPRVTLGRGLLDLPLLARVVTDSHFRERDRMGRLAVFLARIMQDGLLEAPLGLGLDERTAVLIGPDGAAEVFGRGAAYLLRLDAPPAVCAPGQPLTARGLERWRLEAGARLTFPDPRPAGPSVVFDVVEGALSAPDPY